MENNPMYNQFKCWVVPQLISGKVVKLSYCQFVFRDGAFNINQSINWPAVVGVWSFWSDCQAKTLSHDVILDGLVLVDM